MKKEYSSPDAQLILLSVSDIITVSVDPIPETGEMPPIPFSN